jgi:asparagine synthase (glutamine-hydrolysing)
VSITFNGEIYNYLDLRTDLINRGRRFKTRGDAEAIVNAYLAYGMAFPEKLRGIFSFALYDKGTHKLILCRDRVGVKPLYYCMDRASNTLAFASEIKVFLGTVIRKEDVALDYSSLNQYLHFQHCLGDKTMFAGIRKVMPGEMLVYNTKTYEINNFKYWTIDPALVRGGANNYYTETYYQDKVLSVLHRIVREQTPQGVSMGAYASGGIDSSTIISLLSEYRQDFKIATGYYSIPGYDESGYAEHLIKSLPDFDSKKFYCIEITEDDVINNLQQAIYHMDEPCAGPGLIGQYIVAKVIKEHSPDLKVMFGGQGGDELFGGYARYVIAYLESCLQGSIYPSEGKDWVMTLERLSPLMPVLQGYESMIKGFFGKNMFGDRDRRYFDLISRSDEAYLNPEFKAMFYNKGKQQVYDEYLDIFLGLGGVSYFTKMLYFDFKSSLPALLQVDDRTNAAFEMESRVPFLDEELVELAFSIPPLYKFSGGYSKGILRKALSGTVPDKILKRRDKMGFPVPFNEWMNNKDSKLKEFITESLKNGLNEAIFSSATAKTFDRSMWGRLSLSLWQKTFNVGY